MCWIRRPFLAPFVQDFCRLFSWCCELFLAVKVQKDMVSAKNKFISGGNWVKIVALRQK